MKFVKNFWILEIKDLSCRDIGTHNPIERDRERDTTLFPVIWSRKQTVKPKVTRRNW